MNETEMSDRCRWCNGKGKVFAHWFGARKTCPECSGSGRRLRPTAEEKQ